MGVKDATPHGLSSAFRDWAVDCTSFADEISEEALAHTIGPAVRQVYRRGQAMRSVVIFEDFDRSWARQVETIQRASPEW